LRARAREIDVAKNLKMIDWLKAEMVDSIAQLFKSLLLKSSDAVCDALSTIIILAYILGQKVGVSFAEVDTKIKNKLHISLDESLGGEDWLGNLSELLVYLEKSKR